MQISFNPSYTANNAMRMNYARSFGNNVEKEPVKTYSEKEIKTAKTKKAVSECATIAVGIGILYFAMKRNFKFNRIKNHEKKMQELAKLKAPAIKLDANSFIDNFLQV